MNDVIEIVEGNLDDLENVYSRLTEDFAVDELKEYEQLRILLLKKKYKLLFAKHKEFNEIIGYAFIYEIDLINAIWLDYIAIDKRFQNAGYGTMFFNKIANVNQKEILGIFIEIEIPTEQEGSLKATQIKRINFYERLGAKKLNTNYELPTKNGGFPMYLYFRPAEKVQMLPKQEIMAGISSTFNYIHSDVENRKDILNKIVLTIEDAIFC